MRADPEHPGHAAEGQRGDGGGQHRPNACAADGRTEGILDGLAEAVRVRVLERECLYRLDRVERLTRKPARIRDPVLRSARQPADAPPERHERAEDERDQHEDETGEFQARDREHDQAADDRDRRAQGDREIHTRDGLHQCRVGREPRQHLSRTGDFEERRVHADDARIDVGSQVGDYPFAEPGDQVEAQRGKDAEGARGGKKRDEVPVDRLSAAGAHALVDQVSEGDRQREHRGRGRQQREQRKQDRAAIGLQIGPERAQRPERTSPSGDRGC